MADLDSFIDRLAESSGAVKVGISPLSLTFRWLGVSAIYIAAVLSFMGIRQDLLSQITSPQFLIEAGTLIVIIITTLAAGTRLAFPDNAGQNPLTFLPLILFFLFTLVLAFGYMAEDINQPKPPHGFECLRCIALISVTPAIFIFYSLRKMAPTKLMTAGMFAALYAATLGCLVLKLSEETGSFSHLIAWHYFPLFGFACAGTWLGKKLLRW